MKVALLGYPQSGKRTLFKLLTGRDIPPGRKETDQVEGIAPIRDPRVDALVRQFQPEKHGYAENTVVLCPDVLADKGKRAWLEAAQRCDLLAMVVRGFASPHVYHPAGSVDAQRDRRNLAAELLLTDLEIVENRLDRMSREKRAGQTPAQAIEEKTLLKCKESLESERNLSAARLEPHELASIRSLSLLTLQPILWAMNVDESSLAAAQKEALQDRNTFVVSCQIEREVMAIEAPEERIEYMKALGLECSGRDGLNRAAYDALGLMSFYTIANNEVRAWTIRKGTLAPEAGGKVHTDIEKGFIRVEIIKFDDLMAAGSEKAARDAGKMQVKGRDYVIEDGDVCRFRFNV